MEAMSMVQIKQCLRQGTRGIPCSGRTSMAADGSGAAKQKSLWKVLMEGQSQTINPAVLQETIKGCMTGPAFISR